MITVSTLNEVLRIRHGFFTREGGEAYLRDLPNAEMHRLDSGHFAVEDCLEQITTNIERFYDEKLTPVDQTSASRRVA